MQDAKTYQLVELLQEIIRADVVKTIEAMPHLTQAERNIAIGRALRKGIVDDLVSEMVTEEVQLAVAGGHDPSEELLDAFVATAKNVAQA